jgi:hypothetical protein
MEYASARMAARCQTTVQAISHAAENSKFARKMAKNTRLFASLSRNSSFQTIKAES